MSFVSNFFGPGKVALTGALENISKVPLKDYSQALKELASDTFESSTTTIKSQKETIQAMLRDGVTKDQLKGFLNQFVEKMKFLWTKFVGKFKKLTDTLFNTGKEIKPEELQEIIKKHGDTNLARTLKNVTQNTEQKKQAVEAYLSKKSPKMLTYQPSQKPLMLTHSPKD